MIASDRLELALALASSSDGQISVMEAQSMDSEDLIKSLKFYQIKNEAVSKQQPMPSFDVIKERIR